MSTVIRADSLYTIVEGPNWDDSQLNAKSFGGDLVSINSAEENSFIAQEYSQAKYFYDGDSNPGDPDFYTHFWLGGVFNRNSLEWEWVSGQEWEFDYFLRDHPVMPIPNDSGNPEFNYLAGIFNVTSNYPSGGIIHGDGPGTYYWDDGPNDYGGATKNFFKGIAEIPLNLSITTSSTPTEGAGVFTSSINLSAGTEESGNLAEGANVYWQITGITADDLETGALSGSGVITDGKLSIEHSLVNDADSGETFNVSVFSDVENTQQIGATAEFLIEEENIVPEVPASPAIRGNSLYTIVSGPYWSDANISAQSIGGSLVSINSAEENKFIRDSFSFTGLSTGPTDPHCFWIGLYYSNNAWQWLDGTTPGANGYTNWEPTTPVAQPDFIGIENFVKINPDNTGTWQNSTNTWIPNVTYGIAEIPLTSSITFSTTPKEGAGVFTTSINLSAGTEESGNLAEGAEVYWSISGITADDLETGELSGSGAITDGTLSIEHSLVNDADSGENFFVSVFSDTEMTQQIGETQSFEVLEGEADPILGELGLRKKVKLKKKGGREVFRIYGSEEIDVNAIDFDSIVFGRDPDELMAHTPSVDNYFQGAQRKKGKKAGSYRAKVKDINDDGFDDIKMQVFRRDIGGVMEKGDKEIYAFAQMGEESVLWSNTDTVFL